jgi:putative membrane protein
VLDAHATAAGDKLMRKAIATILVLGVPLLAIAACAREERRPAAPRAPYPAPARVAPQAAAPSNAAYLARAASIDLFEIRSSELALQRSTSRSVREFAAMMIGAHKGTSAQLSFAGRRLNLLPSATLEPKHQAMLDQLQSAVNFDAVYREQQRAVHEEALALHRSYAARGTSPTLRPVALAAVPVLERHIRMLRYL